MKEKINFEPENINVNWVSFKFNLFEMISQKKLVLILMFNPVSRLNQKKRTEKLFVRLTFLFFL